MPLPIGGSRLHGHNNIMDLLTLLWPLVGKGKLECLICQEELPLRGVFLSPDEDWAGHNGRQL